MQDDRDSKLLVKDTLGFREERDSSTEGFRPVFSQVQHMLSRHIGICSVVVMLAGVAATRGASTTFHPDEPYTETQNPNGTWSYGWSSTRGSAFHLFGSVDFFAVGNPYWHDSSLSTFPFINYASSDGVGIVGFHPGQSGENAVLRWTAPSAGELDISALFDNPLLTATTDVAILRNGAELFSGNIVPNVSLPPFSGSLIVLAGETFDFTVGFGGNGYGGDSTRLQLELILKSIGSTVPDSAKGLTSIFACAVATMFTLRRATDNSRAGLLN